MTLIHFVRNIYYVLIALKVNGLDNMHSAYILNHCNSL